MPNSVAEFAGICLLLLCIFHIAFVCYGRPPRVFWIIVDWVWISMASFALISGAFEIRRTDAEYRIQILRNLFGGYKMGVENILQIEPYLQKIPDSDATGKWASQLRDKLRSVDRSKDDWELVAFSLQNLIQIEFLKDPQESDQLANLKRETLRDLSELRSMASELAALESTAHRTTFELSVLFLMPWVLTCAIALRLTKVTADYEPWRNNLIRFSAPYIDLTRRVMATAFRLLNRGRAVLVILFQKSLKMFRRGLSLWRNRRK